MNHNDEPNDSAVLGAVRDSISGLPIPTAPRLEAIAARGRARQRRRLGGVSVAAAGACAALAVGLVSVSAPAAPAPSARPAPQHQAPRVQLAAFSVVTGPDGGTTLTLYPGEVADPSAVRQALARHGIAALVTAGRFCRTADQPAPGVGDVVKLPAGPARSTRGRAPGPIVIYGSRIPRGVELSIGYRQDPRDHEISFTLIKARAPRSCTSIPDSGPHGND